MEVLVPIPDGLKGKDITVKFHSQSISVSFRGVDEAPVAGALAGSIDLDGSTWTVDGQVLVISMEKAQPGAWPSLLG